MLSFNLRRKIGLPKLIVISGFAILAVYLWPQYQQLAPKSEYELQEAVIAQIEHIPGQAPLILITEPDDGLEAIRDAIKMASMSIDLVIYELEDPQIESLLVDASNRSVAVRVILQNVNVFGHRPNQDAFDYLSKKGVPVIWASKAFALTHQKTFIVDKEKAFILTFNLNPKYYSSSRDFGLIVTNPEDISAISRAFDSDWRGSRIKADNGQDLVWSPDSARTLLAVIKSAQESLDIYTLEMEDRRIIDALKNSAMRGVDVRVNMTYATGWKSALNELSDAGVHIRTFPSTGDLFIHAKVMIADNVRAFVGSENFSTQSLDLNRELGILVARQDIIASLGATFERDWALSRPFGIEAPKKSKAPDVPIYSVAPGTVKLSKSGICHTSDSSSYSRTIYFTPFDTLDACLNSGGHLPKKYKGATASPQS